KEGYTFTGWYTDAECTTKEPATFTLKADTTLYAGWKIQQRELSFNTLGGSEIAPVTEDFGTQMNLNDYTPTREGYEFTGWYTDEDCKDKAENEFALNNNTTVYAGWKKVEAEAKPEETDKEEKPAEANKEEKPAAAASKEEAKKEEAQKAESAKAESAKAESDNQKAKSVNTAAGTGSLIFGLGAALSAMLAAAFARMYKKEND
ncbi:MAG: InlB B-repeat-containing protein, partial [Erysipelotrichaceae bacterium]|nr:InlB B-repeat-containing protein [Erysipelotrichaceae bacterium]